MFDDKYFDNNAHKITGVMFKLNNEFDDVEAMCKKIIEEEFMDEVYEYLDSVEEILTNENDGYESYAEALRYYDWNNQRYYVQCYDKNGDNLEHPNVYKILEINDDFENVLDVNTQDGEIFEFNLCFVADDEENVCVSTVLDKAMDK